MAVSLTHATVAVGTDAGNGEIAKAQWNEGHTLTAAANSVLARNAATEGAVSDVALAASRLLGRGSTGDVAAISVSADLAISGTVLGIGSSVATLTGSQTLTNKTVEAPTITNGYTEEVATANTGTAYTIDLAGGSVQALTLTGNVTFTFPPATAGRSFLLVLRQDATGSRTVTWPSVTNPVRWPGGTNPTITSTASRTDLYAFTADGTRWYGRTIAQNYSA